MNDTPRLPIFDDIHALPRWAKVALVGRCVERVLPIIRHDWPELPAGGFFLIASAGGLAETAAEAAHETSAAAQTDQAAGFVQEAEQARHHAAAHGIALCGIASALPKIADTRKTTTMVVNALQFLVDAYASIGLNQGAAIGSVWPDFIKIRAAASSGNWTNDTPVSASSFGDLWPNGPPPGWPESRS